MGRFSSLGTAASSLGQGIFGPLLGLLFIVVTGLLTSALVDTNNQSLFVIIAAIFGAYMALNIGANDVANNMGPAVGAKALTMFGAIVIAAVFESAGALIAGGDVVSTIAKGIIAPESMQSSEIYLFHVIRALGSSTVD